MLCFISYLKNAESPITSESIVNEIIDINIPDNPYNLINEIQNVLLVKNIKIISIFKIQD
jgi:hypothetical protein